MCRWAAYTGVPVFLEDIVLKPAHSLVVQSRHAAECKTETNADGVGIAWYDARAEPGLYRDVYPAWSDENLAALCAQIRSRLFIAHVRASTGTATSRTNCHPFAVGRWSFCHNGQIGGYDRFRREAEMAIPDALFAERRGTTDSEVLFLLALAAGLDADPVAAITTALDQLTDLSLAKGEAPHLRASAAFSDGETLWAFRASSDRIAPSVYYREMPGGWAVVSEPLEQDGPGWTALRPGSLAAFSPGAPPELWPLRMRARSSLVGA